MRVDYWVVGPSGSMGAGTGVVMLEEEEVVVVTNDNEATKK